MYIYQYLLGFIFWVHWALFNKTEPIIQTVWIPVRFKLASLYQYCDTITLYIVITVIIL